MLEQFCAIFSPEIITFVNTLRAHIPPWCPQPRVETGELGTYLDIYWEDKYIAIIIDVDIFIAINKPPTPIYHTFSFAETNRAIDIIKSALIDHYTTTFYFSPNGNVSNQLGQTLDPNTLLGDLINITDANLQFLSICDLYMVLNDHDYIDLSGLPENVVNAYRAIPEMINAIGLDWQVASILNTRRDIIKAHFSPVHDFYERFKLREYSSYFSNTELAAAFDKCEQIKVHHYAHTIGRNLYDNNEDGNYKFIVPANFDHMYKISNLPAHELSFYTCIVKYLKNLEEIPLIILCWLSSDKLFSLIQDKLNGEEIFFCKLYFQIFLEPIKKFLQTHTFDGECEHLASVQRNLHLPSKLTTFMGNYYWNDINPQDWELINNTVYGTAFLHWKKAYFSKTRGLANQLTSLVYIENNLFLVLNLQGRGVTMINDIVSDKVPGFFDMFNECRPYVLDISCNKLTNEHVPLLIQLATRVQPKLIIAHGNEITGPIAIDNIDWCVDNNARIYHEYTFAKMDNLRMHLLNTINLNPRIKWYDLDYEFYDTLAAANTNLVNKIIANTLISRYRGRYINLFMALKNKLDMKASGLNLSHIINKYDIDNINCALFSTVIHESCDYIDLTANYLTDWDMSSIYELCAITRPKILNLACNEFTATSNEFFIHLKKIFETNPNIIINFSLPHLDTTLIHNIFKGMPADCIKQLIFTERWDISDPQIKELFKTRLEFTNTELDLLMPQAVFWREFKTKIAV